MTWKDKELYKKKKTVGYVKRRGRERNERGRGRK